uniref:Uncharacterized protein n=1 Tax=Arundo donax TaxID=35708 RepID=A0A0A9I2G6_ARUDO
MSSYTGERDGAGTGAAGPERAAETDEATARGGDRRRRERRGGGSHEGSEGREGGAWSQGASVGWRL